MLILLYLVVYFCVYFFGSRTLIYEVAPGSVASKFENQYTAIALREEQVVGAEGTGYVNFFVGDATPVRAGENTYILDGSGKISAKLEEAAKDQSILSDENLAKIRSTIYEFDSSFDPMNYSDVYAFKYRIQSQIMDLINGSVFDNINKDLQEMGDNTYQIVKSDTAGVVMHNIDGFEGKTPDKLESSDFKKTNYQKQIIKNNSLVAEGDPVYKLATSENWKLVIQIKDATAFDDMPYVNVEFLKDNIVADVDVETFTKAGNTYAVLSLSKYMIRYLGDRFLSIRIVDSTQDGLQVPKTAVTERQYYAIPVEYLTQGGNSNDEGFNKEVISKEDGSTSVTFVTPKLLRTADDEKHVFVDTSEFQAGDVLVMPESGNRFQVGEKQNLKGVYTVNNGFATFALVEIIGENTTFYIIAPRTNNGVRIYDQVIRNGDKVQEGDVVNR